MTAARPTTRRQFLSLLGAAGLVAGCGTGPSGTAGPAPAATRRVTHQFGSFDIPLDPQRVVGLEGRRDLETCLALGITPVGIGSNALYEDDRPAPFVDLPLEGVTVIQQTEPNLEVIASLRPDLVLTRDSNIEELLDQLVAIAPVLPVGSGVDPNNSGDDWRADLQRVAGWLGREDRLGAALAEYDARVDAVRQRHTARLADAVVAIVQFSPDEGFSTSATDGFYLQAQALGAVGGVHLPFLESLDQGEYVATFSVERTSELAPADAILVIVNTEEERAALAAQPLWQRLPAVAAGRVVFTDSRANYGSVYAAGECVRLVDELYATLA
jgi:iron complex transport system substrate-binding protein